MTEIQNPKPICDPEEQNISLVFGITADTISEFAPYPFGHSILLFVI
jgi:hypothetical protein